MAAASLLLVPSRLTPFHSSQSYRKSQATLTSAGINTMAFNLGTASVSLAYKILKQQRIHAAVIVRGSSSAPRTLKL